MVSVLLVDDNEPFCRLVGSMLPEADFQIVGRASGGFEAVRKAEELQPDIILHDIGLPDLNGIDAASRISHLCPRSKIIFLTQERSADIVEAALNTGVSGYVCKTDVHYHLLTAIDMVLRGQKFVSRSVSRPELVDAGSGREQCRHEAVFYSDDVAFAEAFAAFVMAHVRLGKAVVMATTRWHYDRIRQRLAAEGFDVGRAIEQGMWLWIDAAETLSAIVVDGLPERDRFFDEIDALIASISLAKKMKPSDIAFCGERVGLLWSGGNTDAAMQIEKFCEEVARKYDFDMLCAYPLPCREDESTFETICADHSSVYTP